MDHKSLDIGKHISINGLPKGCIIFQIVKLSFKYWNVFIDFYVTVERISSGKESILKSDHFRGVNGTSVDEI